VKYNNVLGRGICGKGHGHKRNLRRENKSRERSRPISRLLRSVPYFGKVPAGHWLEIVRYIRQKEIRKPITKANIKNNWTIVGAQKEIEMSRIYYSRKIEDSAVKAMIERLPFEEIKKITPFDRIVTFCHIRLCEQSAYRILIEIRPKGEFLIK